jgi:radical SAM protein with 4Fe4S-binding SPASM domain
MLMPRERRALAQFHSEHNRLPGGPAIAAFAYLESDELFGCGAGFHHLYIDSTGNVCPCDLTPLSFGNVATESLGDVWKRMASFFPTPRRGCLMNEIARQLAEYRDALPLERPVSERICGACRPETILPEGYRRLVDPARGFRTPGS